MAKIPIKHLVSLIKEQIDNQGVLNQLFPPDKDVYVDDLQKYPELFQTKQDTAPQDDRGKIRTLEPQGQERTLQPEYEPELAMVAEGREFEFPTHTLPEPMRIEANTLVVAPRSKAPGKIVCEDPVTGEMVEGVVISDLVMTTPNGKQILIFRNHGESQQVDRPTVVTRYVVLAENRYMGNKPRGEMWGKEIPRDVLDNLLANPPAEDASEQEKKEWKERVETLQNARAKRYALFPLINRMFSDHGLLDKLDISLIPETWASSIRTEHTTNVTSIKKFGGTTAEIDADFYAVRDLENVEEAIAEVMDLREDLALGALEDDGDNQKTRDREYSTAVPRRHANYIYRNGNWFAKQRVHDENFFRREGGKTQVYELLSQNIQEGTKEVTIESKLEVTGEIVGDEYVLKSIFTADLNVRHPESGAGVKITDDEAYALFPKVVTGLRKPLGNINPEDFTLENHIEFFVNEGRTVSQARTGFLPDFFAQTGENIKETIDPDAILARMVELVEVTAQYNPENDENI